MSVKDGGQAFPTTHPEAGGCQAWTEFGMSLRDYFAAKAMQAEMITSLSDATPEAAEALGTAAALAGQTVVQRIAFNAYQVADAMLAERETSR